MSKDKATLLLAMKKLTHFHVLDCNLFHTWLSFSVQYVLSTSVATSHHFKSLVSEFY